MYNFRCARTLEISHTLLDELATAKLEMVGLSPDDGKKFPSELSGGMTKRAALARALALDPEIVFLDEPTSGLDPISASDFDALISTLQQTLGLTVFMVTHDLDSLNTVCDRVAALAEGKIVEVGPIEQLVSSQHPWVRSYFHNDRARTRATGTIEGTHGNPRTLCSDRRVRPCRDCCGLRFCVLAAQYRRA